MQTLLTPEDSNRVADALIEKIEDADFDVAAAMREAIISVIMPITSAHWKEDWFPLAFENMCDEISNGVVRAAYEAANKKRK